MIALMLAAAGVSPAFGQAENAAAIAPAPVVENAPEAAHPAVPKPATVHVTLLTTAGTIVLELEKQRAPATTANFLRYVDQKRLDGTSFYRALKVKGAENMGLVQGGVQGDPKRLLPPVAHEPTTKTGLSHTNGAISMARTAPGTAQGDFFIIVGDLTSFDADPKRSGDNQGFAVFGHVAEGMDIVRRIMAAPTSATAGAGAMKGQMLASPVRIISARRSK